MMHHIADKAEHIYIALGSTDFRKQQNGLASLISLKFQLDPYSGESVFLFLMLTQGMKRLRKLLVAFASVI